MAGVETAREELLEVVACLRDARRYSRLNAKTPSGVLLCGPPGTGKTLLGEAHSCLCRDVRPSCSRGLLTFVQFFAKTLSVIPLGPAWHPQALSGQDNIVGSSLCFDTLPPPFLHSLMTMGADVERKCIYMVQCSNTAHVCACVPEYVCACMIVCLRQ